MNLYLSYSLSPTDLYLAGMLITQAQQKQIRVQSSHSQATIGADPTSVITEAIRSSDIVVAIVSADSRSENVLMELGVAVGLGRPVLALVENGVSLLQQMRGIQLVQFNRNNMSAALSRMGGILDERRKQADANKWLVAAGIGLFALYLISKNDE
jgi:nucleoside 2-deoxyribosyltransferase-like protein/TIR domain-containing protein